MSQRTENEHQVVVVHSDGTTEVWEKDSAGCTTKEGHSIYHPNSGNTTNHYGTIISTGGQEGHKQSK